MWFLVHWVKLNMVRTTLPDCFFVTCHLKLTLQKQRYDGLRLYLRNPNWQFIMRIKNSILSFAIELWSAQCKAIITKEANLSKDCAQIGIIDVESKLIGPSLTWSVDRRVHYASLGNTSTEQFRHNIVPAFEIAGLQYIAYM